METQSTEKVSAVSRIGEKENEKMKLKLNLKRSNKKIAEIFSSKIL